MNKTPLSIDKIEELRSLLREKRLEHKEAQNKVRFLRNNCDTIVLVTKRLNEEQYTNVLKELKLRVKNLNAEVTVLYSQAYPEQIKANTERVLHRLDNILDNF